MAWYYILFFSCLAFFILKTAISWMFGDTDIDFDTDGDVDFDISSMFSFKGVLHFLLGFSTYLAATAKFDRTYDVIGSYQFTWLHYVIAIVIGIVFMYGLFKLYQLMMKLNYGNESNPDFSGCDCTVLTNLNNGSYVVLVKTTSGMFRKTFKHMTTNKEITVGTQLRVAKEISTGEYVIA